MLGTGFYFLTVECETGVLGCPRSCLHAILSLLQRGTEIRSGPVLAQQAPHLAELCYQVKSNQCPGAVIVKLFLLANFHLGNGKLVLK